MTTLPRTSTPVPLRVGVGRSRTTESSHAVHAVVAADDGAVVASFGDAARPTFARSAVKALQALVLVESGAADAFGFSAADLALACSSHSATPPHVEVARGMLAKAGVDPECLACGSHWPLDDDAARALARTGASPSALHNNCSGKHAGFLAAARHLGAPLAGYVEPDHPVQRRVADVLGSMTGAAIRSADRAVDGCSVPTWAVPLAGLAVAFARFGTGRGLAEPRAWACAALRAAVAANPLLVAGPGRFDTRVIETCGSRVFLKSGAEGVLCAAIPAAGIGIAVKAEDGAQRASEAAMAALLLVHLPSPTAEERGLLEVLEAPTLRNWRGMTVGGIAVESAATP